MHFSATFLVTAFLVLQVFAGSSLLVNDAKSLSEIKDEYIVTFKSNNRPSFITHNNTDVIYHYNIINGVAGKFTAKQIKELQASPDVERIYEDHDGIATINSAPSNDTSIQRNATWGLACLSSKTPLTYKNVIATNFTFYYYALAGYKVDIYVVDSGININHTDFDGRARWGKTFGGYPDIDDHGHGTHCAGLAAGKTYGVARKAEIIAVKTGGCDLKKVKISDTISGLEWVHEQIKASSHHSVVLLNIGVNGTSQVYDDAVISLTNDDIPVAAGNMAKPASYFSPGHLPSTITVASSTISDQEASSSNFGDAIDIFAPGQDIVSTGIGSTTATKVDSGTSMVFTTF
ncbi:hypothetical protein C0995_007075 [Termitomyces sp. Mi166|nr:hypothetical protein C0995_007075 [Termitomyces sp. Mi166\